MGAAPHAGVASGACGAHGGGPWPPRGRDVPGARPKRPLLGLGRHADPRLGLVRRPPLHRYPPRSCPFPNPCRRQTADGGGLQSLCTCLQSSTHSSVVSPSITVIDDVRLGRDVQARCAAWPLRVSLPRVCAQTDPRTDAHRGHVINHSSAWGASACVGAALRRNRGDRARVQGRRRSCSRCSLCAATAPP